MVNDNNDEFQRAYSAALRLLGLCDRSRKDLRERLSKKGHPPDAVERVFDRLESMGYIDDERYALKFASDAVKRKNASPAAIRYGLQQKGVLREIIEEAVSKVFQENDEKEVAARALRKRLEVRSKKQEIRGNEIKRLSDYLRRKGFSYAIIKETLKELEIEDEI